MSRVNLNDRMQPLGFKLFHTQRIILIRYTHSFGFILRLKSFKSRLFVHRLHSVNPIKVTQIEH